MHTWNNPGAVAGLDQVWLPGVQGWQKSVIWWPNQDVTTVERPQAATRSHITFEENSFYCWDCQMLSSPEQETPAKRNLWTWKYSYPLSSPVWPASIPALCAAQPQHLSKSGASLWGANPGETPDTYSGPLYCFHKCQWREEKDLVECSLSSEDILEEPSSVLLLLITNCLWHHR